MSKQSALLQLYAAVAVSLVAMLLAGKHGAVSALAGSASVWAGLLLALLSMRQANNALKKMNITGGGALLVLLRAEAIKIAVISTVLWITFKIYASHLVPLALISGLAVAALLSGAGLMRVNETK